MELTPAFKKLNEVNQRVARDLKERFKPEDGFPEPEPVRAFLKDSLEPYIKQLTPDELTEIVVTFNTQMVMEAIRDAAKEKLVKDAILEFAKKIQGVNKPANPTQPPPTNPDEGAGI